MCDTQAEGRAKVAGYTKKVHFLYVHTCFNGALQKDQQSGKNKNWFIVHAVTDNIHAIRIR